MEYRSRQQDLRAALRHRLVEVLQVACAAGGNDGNRHGTRDRPGELDVVAGLGAVAVHAGGKDRAGAQLLALPRPLHGVLGHGPGAAGDHQLESRRHLGISPGVDRHRHLAGAERFGCSPDQVRVGHRGAVHGDLVGAGLQNQLDVLQGGNAAADRQRDLENRGHLLDPLQPGLPVLEGRGDVQHGQLVRAFLLIEPGVLDGIACILEVHEVNALDDASLLHVEARHDLDGAHHPFSFPSSEHGSVCIPPGIAVHCPAPGTSLAVRARREPHAESTPIGAPAPGERRASCRSASRFPPGARPPRPGWRPPCARRTPAPRRPDPCPVRR